jgi:hypothetical protein
MVMKLDIPFASRHFASAFAHHSVRLCLDDNPSQRVGVNAGVLGILQYIQDTVDVQT